MKKMILFAIILFLILPGITRADERYEEYDLLYDVMNELGGEIKEGDMVFNGIIKQGFMGEEELTLKAEEIRRDLNIIGTEIDPLIVYDELEKETYGKEVIFDTDFNQINYYGYDENNNAITIILSSYLDAQTLRGETYLCINIVKDSDFLEINDIIEKVRFIFQTSDSPMEITTCLIGEFPGQIGDVDMEEKVNNVLGKFESEIIEEYTDESLLSYTIYSPLIENYLMIDKKKINLNLAIRYNEYEDKTNILIATPIITTGY